MKITLCAVDDGLTQAWKRFCGDLDFVSVYHGSILDVDCDAVVSPANSFGFMDGGIDLIYSQHFGWDIQYRLQTLIKNKHGSELLVGTAEIVETEDEVIPFLIAAPTMRVPMILRDSINPYLAARAVMRLIQSGVFVSGAYVGEAVSEHVRHVAFPGLGTGVGRVGPNTCAHQVRAAIDTVVLGEDRFPATWSEAQSQHQALYTDRIRDLQYE